MIENLKKGAILPNKVVVQEIKPEEKKTQGGLILQNMGKNPQIKGVVVLTGDPLADIPMTVKEGMTVLYTPLAAQKFTFEEEDFLLLDQNSVLFMYYE